MEVTINIFSLCVHQKFTLCNKQFIKKHYFCSDFFLKPQQHYHKE